MNRTLSKEIKKRFLKALAIIAKEQYPEVKEVHVIEAVGLSPSNFYRMRSEPNNYPTLDHCARLCSVYSISGDWLLTGKGNIKDFTEVKPAIELLKDAVQQIEIQLNGSVKSVPKSRKINKSANT